MALRASRPSKRRHDGRAYKTLLKALEPSHPRMVSLLKMADDNRRERLAHWKDGVRLRGYEELVTHLDAMTDVYRKHTQLAPVSFLVSRTRSDFVTALEATLSGFHTVAHDAMRDVMEIEFLLRDFFFEPAHIAEWLMMDEKERYAKFRPAVVRQRFAKRIGRQPQDLSEAADYRGHSMFLHVNPLQNPFGGPGITQGDIAFSADSGFWEIFEHARRLLFALHRLRRKLAPHINSPKGPERGLRAFRQGWEQTQDWQQIFYALQKVAREEAATR
jgi:hypothetical protein